MIDTPRYGNRIMAVPDPENPGMATVAWPAKPSPYAFAAFFHAAANMLATPGQRERSVGFASDGTEVELSGVTLPKGDWAFVRHELTAADGKPRLTAWAVLQEGDGSIQDDAAGILIRGDDLSMIGALLTDLVTSSSEAKPVRAEIEAFMASMQG